MVRMTMWDGTRLAVPEDAARWQRGHIDPPRGWDICVYVQEDGTPSSSRKTAKQIRKGRRDAGSKRNRVIPLSCTSTAFRA